MKPGRKVEIVSRYIWWKVVSLQGNTLIYSLSTPLAPLCPPLCDAQESLAKSGGRVVIMNNYDWWKGVSLLEFLRDVGKYARVGTMMAKESVKKRLQSEDGMSYTEFTYQLLQVGPLQ